MSIEKKTSGVVFRSNQRVKSRDGRQIYLYTSGKCELYEGDRCTATLEYQVVGNEIRLILEGKVLYKASFQYKSNRRDISSLTLSGTTYYAF